MTTNVLTPSGATALIPVFTGTINFKTVQLCDARTLHTFMGVLRDFTDWIKGRIRKFGFVEGVDFAIVANLSSPEKGSSKARAQKLTDYHLTLDMAKELSMVENNTKGREARRYFLECERLVHEAVQKEFKRAAVLPAKHDTLPLRINLSQHAGLQKFCVSSIDVARDFKINNRTVVRHIKNLKCSQKFHERNFVLTQYKVGKGTNRLCYLISRDGFAMLSRHLPTMMVSASWVGCGSDAVDTAGIKEAYFERFHAKEEEWAAAMLRPEVRVWAGKPPLPPHLPNLQQEVLQVVRDELHKAVAALPLAGAPATPEPPKPILSILEQMTAVDGIFIETAELLKISQVCSEKLAERFANLSQSSV